MRTYVMWYNKRLSLLYQDFIILKNGHHYDAILKIDNTSVDDLLPQDAREHEIRIGKLTERNEIKRASMDKRPINGHGKQLLHLCKTTGLVIFNGRLGNDCSVGKFTRIQGASAGVVDYAFGSTALFERIIEFDVNDKFPKSDHIPVSFSIACNTISKPEMHESKFHWTGLTR